jgi:hypothetical protein
VVCMSLSYGLIFQDCSASCWIYQCAKCQRTRR